MRICSIDNCNQPHQAKGWCLKHWLRWRRRGDPLAEPYAHMKGKPPVVALAKLASNPSLIARRNDSIRAAQKNPDVIARHSVASKAVHARPGHKARLGTAVSAGLRRHWKTVSPQEKETRLANWISAGHRASADITISGT